jgi:5-methylcytosine-specific restriction protein A
MGLADGNRNPAWAWEEQILAFELFLMDGNLGRDHPKVVALSKLLRTLPIHPAEARNESFRTPSSVDRKLSDIYTHRPGYAGKRTSGSKLDTRVWEEFGENLAEVSIRANQIRASVTDAANVEDDEDEVDSIHEEGRVAYRLHRRRERDRDLVDKKWKQVKKSRGKLTCEACDLVLSERYATARADVYECHHVIPLHVAGVVKSTVADLLLLCPTCHRIAHRIKPWPNLAQLRAVLAS